METDCPCKRVKCSRHSDCVLCRAHHAEKNCLPACDRIKQKLERKRIRKERRKREE